MLTVPQPAPVRTAADHAAEAVQHAADFRVAAAAGDRPAALDAASRAGFSWGLAEALGANRADLAAAMAVHSAGTR